MSEDPRDKILKLLRLTTSDNDGEALSAIRIANKLLKKDNLGWDTVLGGGQTRVVYVDRVIEKVVYREKPTPKAKPKKEEAPGEKVLHFGKYRGEKLSDVPESYLEWLLEQDWLNDKLREAIEDMGV